MPLFPEEPQIHESVPGPRATPAAGRTVPTPRPVPGPGPRPVPRRPGTPGPNRGPAAPPSQRAAGDAAKPAPPAKAPSTPQIQLIPASVQGALDAADEAVDLLLDSGRAPSDILVLTTGDQHPWAAHELSFGEDSYWAQHDAGDDVFYADIEASRAQSRPVVVVAVNGGADASVARALPGAMARAKVLLIVCGDPQRINSLMTAGV
ncbi:hypothetical protein LRS74_08220 [Streptomyces sp. LX-29]|uniref:hypothetical protein n=1 Tax=Streptomyces sp. LX-29 TaxID=2900152 RepID=UPI00240E7103|nr:hypothetical protein [Streptomyces sp. LX-29]WFB07038.1 hypothetical protein LRS74_08220 [Streptomyces sp. LX-29]